MAGNELQNTKPTITGWSFNSGRCKSNKSIKLAVGDKSVLYDS